jgi:hypothetical protein
MENNYYDLFEDNWYLTEVFHDESQSDGNRWMVALKNKAEESIYYEDHYYKSDAVRVAKNFFNNKRCEKIVIFKKNKEIEFLKCLHKVESPFQKLDPTQAEDIARLLTTITLNSDRITQMSGDNKIVLKILDPGSYYECRVAKDEAILDLEFHHGISLSTLERVKQFYKSDVHQLKMFCKQR